MGCLGPRIGRGSRVRRQGLCALLLTTLLAACAPGGELPQTTQSLPDFRQLAGMSEADLRLALGEPEFRRHDPPAEVWQYRGRTCVLDVFLYRQGEQYRVVYAETHGRDMIPVSQSSCYATLLVQHQPEA